jgi:[ribosomal protein S5]-alanine N-acetyltransferase
MEKSIFLKGNQIYLRKLEVTDASIDYLSWLNCYDVTKFTESRFYPQSFESLTEYIVNANNSTNITFAIVDLLSDKHIGNVKLGNINWIHRYADIGLIIGDSNFWNKGIAKEAISLVVGYGFNTLNLRKIVAGIYSMNKGSIRAFEKAGFSKAYTEKEKYYFEGKYIDSFVFEIFNKMDFQKD